MMRPLLGFLLLIVTFRGYAAGSIDPGLVHSMDRDVEAIMRRWDTPGVVIAVIKNGKTLYRHAYGLRNVEARLPMTLNTSVEIGSITKQFTAAAILQLKEKGKLDIDDKLSKYLPDVQHADSVTLRQLMAHTSGMPEYLTGPDLPEAATRQVTFDMLMKRIAGKPLDFDPGTRWSYSNTGYILLGKVIEAVSGEKYDAYVRSHLLAPAGMMQTTTVAGEPRVENMARGYQRVDGKLVAAPTIADSFGWSAGNLVSTVEDLEKWNLALTEGHIVDPDDYALMTSPVDISQGKAKYGLGFFVDEVEGEKRIGHTGGSFGFTTANEYFPSQKLRIIAFTNNGSSPEAGEIITSALFNELYPMTARAAAHRGAGEDTRLTLLAKQVFSRIQSGSSDWSILSDHLSRKMRNGLSSRMKAQYGDFGTPTGFIFKKKTVDHELAWYDYWLEFGPGCNLKFGIGVDSSGKVASISTG